MDSCRDNACESLAILSLPADRDLNRRSNLVMNHDNTNEKGREMRHLRFVFLLLIGMVQVGISGRVVLAQEKSMRMSMVLLSQPRLPKGDDVVRSFSAFATEGQGVQLASKKETRRDSEILEFELRPNGKAFVMLVPVAVPNREADDAVRFSLSAMGTGWKLPVHKAHLIVTSNTSGDALESLSLLTSLLAAVLKASNAVGIYWGEAGATHDPKFFLETAKESDVDSRIMLWTGVSVAREADGRMSLLSVGMKQLNLPDLLLIAPKSMGNDALDPFFTFLTYVARFGKPLPEGDTIGRSETEKLPVQYVPSPLDPKTRVWRLELK
jgi:Domain of unknown function (DUF4261)